MELFCCETRDKARILFEIIRCKSHNLTSAHIRYWDFKTNITSQKKIRPLLSELSLWFVKINLQFFVVAGRGTRCRSGCGWMIQNMIWIKGKYFKIVYHNNDKNNNYSQPQFELNNDGLALQMDCNCKGICPPPPSIQIKRSITFDNIYLF